jgi:transcriptional regulator NrdR family protein
MAVASSIVATKLSGSMRLALRKRPVSSDALDEAIAHLEERVISLGERIQHPELVRW